MGRGARWAPHARPAAPGASPADTALCYHCCTLQYSAVLYSDVVYSAVMYSVQYSNAWAGPASQESQAADCRRRRESPNLPILIGLDENLLVFSRELL